MTLCIYTIWKQIPRYLCAKTGLLLLFLLPVCSCSNPGKKPKDNSSTSTTTQDPLSYKKPASGFDDTLIIRENAAVLFSPDSVQLRKIKEIVDNKRYETDTHDCFYQMRNARLVMKKYWPALPIAETSRHRWLLFLKADKSKVFIDLDSKGEMCGILLFDTRKDPELVDMMNIETALRFYFEK